MAGGRQANASTNRAMIVKADGTERRGVGELVNEAGAWTQFAGWAPDGQTAVVLRGWESVENARGEDGTLRSARSDLFNATGLLPFQTLRRTCTIYDQFLKESNQDGFQEVEIQ